MFDLDLRSIVLATSLLSLLLAVALWLLPRSYPVAIKGAGLWAGALVLAFSSATLFAVQDALPSIAKLLANALLLLGVALFYFGSQAFLGRRVVVGRWLALITVALSVVAWYTYVQPMHNVRLLVLSLVWLALAVAHAQLIWQHGGDAFAARFVGVVLLVQVLVVVARLLAIALPDSGNAVFDATPIQTAYVILTVLNPPILSVGLMLLMMERLRAEFEHLATHDALTGALSRRALTDACELELSRCRRYERCMSVLVMDLDNFKEVNDKRGHQMGDLVLVDFVRRVTPLLRVSDRLCRYGGEEFVLLLPDTNIDQAGAVAERIRSAMEPASIELPRCTVSIGVTTCRTDDVSVPAILERADQAMYQAKRAGRNRVVVA